METAEAAYERGVRDATRIMNIADPMEAMVRDFRATFGLTIPARPRMPGAIEWRLHNRLIKEEHAETARGWAEGDMVELADGIADSIYVWLGAGVAFGFPVTKLVQEVHRSNMTKLWPDGEPHYDAGGKVLKPDTYSPANIEAVLMQAGWRQP